MRCVERESRFPGGKSVSVALCIHNKRIVRVSISGDFFAFPETCIDTLERLLLGCCSEECIDAAIQKVSNECRALGFEWPWLERLVIELWREGCRS
ncbi:MAG: hypothetical protein GXO32_04240 [Crenarchaeota archaeon]|nr:hypothetical protein [Thermoproteota archaeon]